MKRESRSFLTNVLIDSDFDDIYRCLVVLANPRTILDNQLTESGTKNTLIRADQLVATIKAINEEKGSGKAKGPWSATLNNAEWFLKRHKENQTDYAAKYRAAVCETVSDTTQISNATTLSHAVGISETVEIASAAHDNKISSVAPPSNAISTSKSVRMPSDTVVCPRCGESMVLRTAKRGERKGKQFYGCSTYPKCRGLINVD